MNSFYERIEALLNRCGLTISDIPGDIQSEAGTAEIIDRLEWALENQVTLHENLMHVISNADIPEGVSYDQFCLVVDSIYKAIQTAQEGWENYEEGAAEAWNRRAQDEPQT